MRTRKEDEQNEKVVNTFLSGQAIVYNGFSNYKSAKQCTEELIKYLNVKKEPRGKKQPYTLYHHFTISFPLQYMNEYENRDEKVSRMLEIITSRVFSQFNATYIHSIHNEKPNQPNSEDYPHDKPHAHILLRAKNDFGKRISFNRANLRELRSIIAEETNNLKASSEITATQKIDRIDEWKKMLGIDKDLINDLKVIKKFPKFCEQYLRPYYETKDDKPVFKEPKGDENNPLNMFVDPSNAKWAIELMLAEEMENKGKKSLTKWYFTHRPEVFGRLLYTKPTQKTNERNWRKLLPELSPEKRGLHYCKPIQQLKLNEISDLILKKTLAKVSQTTFKIWNNIEDLENKTSIKLSDAKQVVSLISKNSKQKLTEIVNNHNFNGRGGRSR